MRRERIPLSLTIKQNGPGWNAIAIVRWITAIGSGRSPKAVPARSSQPAASLRSSPRFNSDDAAGFKGGEEMEIKQSLGKNVSILYRLKTFGIFAIYTSNGWARSRYPSFAAVARRSLERQRLCGSN
jgi:hypothetical protein